MDTIVLNAENLSIGYKNKDELISVASHINLNFKESQLIALVGANGIGKSTLLRTISGIQKPLAGNIFLAGENIVTYDNKTLARKISIVLTEKLPPSNLNVQEIIALGRQPYTNWIGKLTEKDLVTIQNAMELTGIRHLAQKKNYELSDGQLQKVMISRAIAQDTPIIILDEPTTHLDLQHKASLFTLLKNLTSSTGKCIIFSTHEIDLAIQTSDQMVVMTQETTFQNSPSELIGGGIFTRIFNNENIYFDDIARKFILKHF